MHVGEIVKGGVATYLKELINFQQKAIGNNNVFLFISQLSEKNFNLKDSNIMVYNYKRNIFNILGTIFELARYIKKVKPDIIHAHSSFAGLMVRVLYYFSFNKNRPKIIYCSHGWSFLMDIGRFKKKIYLFIEKVLARKTDLIINISKYEHTQALKLGMDKEKLVLIPNGIHRHCNYDYKPDIILNNNKINILFIGRFDKQKGLDYLLNVFNNNSNYLNNIKLYTMGESVIHKYKDLQIPKNVSNIGWVDNKYVDSYIKLFDAIIIPSRWEGFGLVALEGMKNKKALIVSNRGALPDLVIDGHNGFVFNFDNPKSLVSILMKINKKQLNVMGENGYKKFISQYQSDKMNFEILKQYKKVLNIG
ncbi:glycosyltransferase [Heyndrickxia coagulans]|nr:glycosyltransferase [Heyndrickxia coagulans]